MQFKQIEVIKKLAFEIPIQVIYEQTEGSFSNFVRQKQLDNQANKFLISVFGPWKFLPPRWECSQGHAGTTLIR